MENKKPLSESDIVIFGGLGNLALNKIIPALFHRSSDGQLPKKSRIIVADRAKINSSSYKAKIKKALKKSVHKNYFNEKLWKNFAAMLHYVQLDAVDAKNYKALKEVVEEKSRKVRIFYLATQSNLFSSICQNLKRSGLTTPFSRVVLEKPLGNNLNSFREINRNVLECFSEQQVYRIDHYLGKETVQNLMIIRFANNLFERIWNSQAIDNVQIIVSEDVGVDGRGDYYDKFGAMRDMVQNHILQVLCLTAMEPPNTITADTVRNEKLKVLRSLREIKPEEFGQKVVRGQYGASKKMKGYKAECGNTKSQTETFIAMKLEVDNWRWGGMPFYIMTGKRLAKKYSEIILQFKPAPHHIFPGVPEDLSPNKLIIRLQPDESVKLQMITKIPGPGGYRLKPVLMNLSLTEEFKERYPDAYERLLMDVVRGNQTLFMSSDEVEASWVWVEKILENWNSKNCPIRTYPAGTKIPDEAKSLTAKEGFSWHEG